MQLPGEWPFEDAVARRPYHQMQSTDLGSTLSLTKNSNPLTARAGLEKFFKKGLEPLQHLLLTLREPRRNYDQDWIGKVWILPNNSRG